MPENAEQIEARLCAYVDGELDAAEKAQIEAHLTANPSHATLLSQLMRQKQAIQRLPREHAPADLMDEFQAQLEREVLLKIDPVTPDARSHSALGRWMAAAAVFALASGLGIIIYTVLPKGQPAIVAMDTQPQQPAPLALPAAPPARGGTAADDVDRLQPIARKGLPETTALAKSGAPEPAASIDAPAAQIAPTASRLATVDKSLNNKTGELADTEVAQTIVVTVMAGDLKQTNQDVLAYLSSNGLDYVLAEGEMSADAGNDRQGAFYQLDQQQVRRALAQSPQQHDAMALQAKQQQELEAAKTPERSPSSANAVSQRGSGALPLEAAGADFKAQDQVGLTRAAKADGQSFVAGRAGDPQAPAVAEELRVPTRDRSLKDAAEGTAALPPIAAAPSTQPAMVIAETKVFQSPGMALGGGGGGGMGRESVRPFGLAGKAAEAPVAAEAITEDRMDNGRVIIVRNINGQQVADLKNVLFRPAANQAVPAGESQTAFRFGRPDGAAAGQDGAPANGVVELLARPGKAVELLGDMLHVWSPATRPAAGNLARMEQQQSQAVQAMGALDGLARLDRYNCVIVLQRNAMIAPATRPVTAGEETINKPAAEK